MTSSALHRASLEVLRAEARDELLSVIMERCELGEDPWDFMEQLPTIDEIVVLSLRADVQGPSALSAAADYALLREIAILHPPLSRAVWRLLDRAAA